MPIIRGPRPQGNFYLLDKSISEDRRLSWAARGLLIFLLGKPDHWTVSVQALVNETSAAGRRTGRDAVYGLLNELISAGYIIRIQSNGAGGFGDTDYIVNESPLPENPDAASPLPDSPYTGEPFPANPTLASIEDKQELSGSNTTAGADAPAPSVVDLFAEAWLHYPKRSGGNSRSAAIKAWNARIKQGVSPDVMLAGVKRYALWCAANNRIGTSFVKQAATFFGPDEHYLEDYAVQHGVSADGKFDPLSYIHGKAQGSAVDAFTIDGEVRRVD